MHVAAVRAQIRPDPVKRVGNPAMHVVRVQAVDEQQAGHQVVGGQPVQHAGVRPIDRRPAIIRDKPAP